MFPTTLRDKLPPFLSYPVGAAVMSRELAGTPQAAEMRLTFNANRALQHKETRRQPYLVLRVNYAHVPMASFGSSRIMESFGFFDPNWSITVFAVPRDMRQVVVQLMTETGIPRIREWLIAHATLPAFVRRKYLRISFDEGLLELVFDEITEPDG